MGYYVLEKGEEEEEEGKTKKRTLLEFVCNDVQDKSKKSKSI